VVRRPPTDSRQVAETWGLGDWHDAQQYPDHEKVGIDVWCWQFLRRSSQYRTFWGSIVLPLQRRRAALPQLVERKVAGQLGEAEAVALQMELLELPPDEAAPLIERLRGGQTPVGLMPEKTLPGGRTCLAAAEAMQTFGLFHAIDPRASGEGHLPLFVGPILELQVGEVSQDRHRVSPILDTRWSARPQLESAEDILGSRRNLLAFDGLSEEQRRLMAEAVKAGDFAAAAALMAKPPVVEPRARVDRYADYLRVLDARETGATRSEIARVLFSPLLDLATGVDRVKRDIAVAVALRDGGWRQLLLSR
jgi:hypothetical protein